MAADATRSPTLLSLIVRSLGGLLFLMSMLALPLFASAGTVDYWQAWVYLAVFFLCTASITAYLMVKDRRLLKSRLQVGPASEPQRSQQAIQALAGALFLLLYVVPGLDRRFGWSNVPPAASILADAIVALGLFIVFLVFRENTFTSAVIEVAVEQRVVSTGPYRLVRHPMYSGAMLMLIFTPPALGSWVGILFALPVMAAIVVRLLNEENFLHANLAGYDEYRRKVLYRLIPGVW